MDLYHIGENCTHIIAISNSGNLAADFYKYGCSFYDAAEQVIKTLFKKQTYISLVATHNNMNKAHKIIKELFDTGNLSEQTYESSLPQLIIEGREYYLQSVVAFHNFDQRSDLFRYPCSKDLDSYFLTEKKFDIDNVASCFEELCNFLDATNDMLGTIKDCESEAVAEVARCSDY